MNILQIKQNNVVFNFDCNEIIRLKASSNYTLIYLSNNTKLLTTKVLLNYEQQLVGEGFIRAHHSHLINSHFIKYIDNRDNIYMNDDTKITVARRRKKDVLLQLNKISE
jgi:two-component system, LytTR family, response regulator